MDAFLHHLNVMTPKVCCHLLSTQSPLLPLHVQVLVSKAESVLVFVLKHSLKVSGSTVASTFVKGWGLVQKEDAQKLRIG